jgi:hypothetical protein
VPNTILSAIVVCPKRISGSHPAPGAVKYFGRWAWRDLADQLTPYQVAKLEEMERISTQDAAETQVVLPATTARVPPCDRLMGIDQRAVDG